MTFSAYYVFFISRKVKTPTEMPKKKKKDLCSVWRKCCDRSSMSKAVCKIPWLDDVPWSGRPVEVDRDQIKTLIENNEVLH